MANQTFLDGGVNARVVCRVWDGVDVGGEKNSDTWMWFFNDRLLFKQEAGQGPFMDDQALSVLGLAVSNPTTSIGSYFSESSLVFSKLNITQHQGTIRCQNQQGNSSWTLSVTVLLSPCKMANEAISPCPPTFFISNFSNF